MTGSSEALSRPGQGPLPGQGEEPGWGWGGRGGLGRGGAAVLPAQLTEFQALLLPLCLQPQNENNE